MKAKSTKRRNAGSSGISSDKTYLESLKSLDTEEGIDLAFYRPIGYAWACLAKRFGISPNAITIASIFLGVAAGIMFYFDALWINVIGMILLMWANSFDSADGQLARMTKQYSRLGRILDGISGDIWFVAIYLAICLRETSLPPCLSGHHWLIWVIAAGAGISHAKQAAMADYYRQFHLYFLKGEYGCELDKGFNLKRRLASLEWKQDFWHKLTLTFYTNYTLQQEASSPAMQSLRSLLSQRFPDGQIPADFRKMFRDKSLPLMKYTNMLTFNWRTIILFASLFAGMPWLYFVFELTVFNILLLYMMIRHENICRHFIRQLNDGAI